MSNGQTMTPEQALANLDGVCAQVAVSRQQHAVLQQSVAVIAQAIAALPKPAEPEEPAVVSGEVETDVEAPANRKGRKPRRRKKLPEYRTGPWPAEQEVEAG